MSEIVIVANPDKPEAMRLAESVQQHLSTQGKAHYLSLGFDEDLSHREAGMVVVFGGDGTVLGAVQRFNGVAPPILAFNVGRLGYLAGNPPNRIMEMIDDALAGQLSSSLRMMLEVKITESDGRRWRVLALNEVVLSSSRPGRMIPLAVKVDGEDVMFSRGDGIIISTPTGSTAYALSAGGPVASPTLDAMILAPLCPHQLANRPLVLGPDEKIHLGRFGGQEVSLTVDGTRNHLVGSGAAIEACKAEHRICLLSPPRGKFTTLREKLGWGWGEEKAASRESARFRR